MEPTKLQKAVDWLVVNVPEEVAEVIDAIYEAAVDVALDPTPEKVAKLRTTLEIPTTTDA